MVRGLVAKNNKGKWLTWRIKLSPSYVDNNLIWTTTPQNNLTQPTLISMDFFLINYIFNLNKFELKIKTKSNKIKLENRWGRLLLFLVLLLRCFFFENSSSTLFIVSSSASPTSTANGTFDPNCFSAWRELDSTAFSIIDSSSTGSSSTTVVLYLPWP